MTSSLEFDYDDRSVRCCILKTLLSKNSIQATEIYNIVKSTYMPHVTYPAVYKALKMLASEKKILKHNRSFSLNLDWTKRLRIFAEDAEKNHSGKSISLPGIDEFTDDNQTQTFMFKNLAETDEYRKRLQIEYLNMKKIHPYCAMYHHLKSPIIHSEKSLNILSVLTKNKIHSYLAVASNSVIDKWCARFYMRNPMVYVKTGLIIPSVEMCETMILDDIIVQMYMPQHIQNYIHYLYKKVKKIDDINAFEFYEKVYKSPSNTKIIIIRNKQIAGSMRNQILNYFRKM